MKHKAHVQDVRFILSRLTCASSDAIIYSEAKEVIISIKQTASNISQKFDIFWGKEYKYQGSLGAAAVLQNFEMSDAQNGVSFVGRYESPKWFDLIPFKYLFGRPSMFKNSVVEKNGAPLGGFSFSKVGLYKKRYVITDAVLGREYFAYTYAHGSFEYISIYFGDAQIALVENYLNTINLCNNYKLYILDEYDDCADLFALFVLYFDNWNYTHRINMQRGSYHTYVVAQFTRYKKMYDPEWREKYFPDEDFFGKTSLLPKE